MPRIRRGKFNQYTFERIVAEEGNGEYEVTGRFINITTPVEMKHVTCGHTWMVLPNNFKNKKTRCPKCFGRGAIKVTTDTVRERLHEVVGNEYVIAGEYNDETKKIALKHVSCGKIWDASLRHFFNRGTRCPSCSKRKTQAAE